MAVAAVATVAVTTVDVWTILSKEMDAKPWRSDRTEAGMAWCTKRHFIARADNGRETGAMNSDAGVGYQLGGGRG
jgi:hypothetical protein